MAALPWSVSATFDPSRRLVQCVALTPRPVRKITFLNGPALCRAETFSVGARVSTLTSLGSQLKWKHAGNMPSVERRTIRYFVALARDIPWHYANCGSNSPTHDSLFEGFHNPNRRYGIFRSTFRAFIDLASTGQCSKSRRRVLCVDRFKEAPSRD